MEQQRRKPGPRPGLRPRRDVYLQIGMTPAEKATIQRHCDGLGITASFYVRQLIEADRAKNWPNPR